MNQHTSNIDEARRCLLCRNARCSAACPVNTPVPTAMKIFREGGDLSEAGKILFDNNPLSAITSQVCDWNRLCYGHCILNAKKVPVHWHDVEFEISGAYLMEHETEVGGPCGKSVAIIGAGPAGITAAIKLMEKGFAVTMYDDNEHIGGVLRYGIPKFRLDHKYVDAYERMLLDAGLEFQGGHKMDALDFEVLKQEFDAVLVAGGAWKPRKLDIPGEASDKVIYALDYLHDPEAYRLSGKVFVVGGGNVTMDAARTAVRSGCDTHIWYRKTFENMPANSMEVEETREDGVQFHLFRVPVEIKEDNIAVMRKCENVVDEATGRVKTRMIPGEDIEEKFDHMIVAISENVDYGVLGDGFPQTEKGWPDTDENLRLRDTNVFLAGDFYSGPKTVVEAVASAKTAVEGILRYTGV